MSDAAFVRRELVLALTGVGVGALLLTGDAAPLAAWSVAGVAAVVAAAVLAVADRVRGRRRVLLLVIPLGVVGFGLLLVGGPDPARVGAGIAGMNLGWVLNRVVFGVIRDVPAPRLARERA